MNLALRSTADECNAKLLIILYRQERDGKEEEEEEKKKEKEKERESVYI